MNGSILRFDDTIETVLNTDLSTDTGRQAVWRQLVDLIGRRRTRPDRYAITLLHGIRAEVPVEVRAASARAIEPADPPVELVLLFAADELRVALPVLRGATMSAQDWIALLPHLRPEARSVLRARRDLADSVGEALNRYGHTDFILRDDRAPGDVALSAHAAEPILESPDAARAVATSPAAPPIADIDAVRQHASELPLAIDWTQVIGLSDEETQAANSSVDAPKSVINAESSAVTSRAPAASGSAMSRAEDQTNESGGGSAPKGPDGAPSFESVGSIARQIPIVALAFRRADRAGVDHAELLPAGRGADRKRIAPPSQPATTVMSSGLRSDDGDGSASQRPIEGEGNEPPLLPRPNREAEPVLFDASGGKANDAAVAASVGTFRIADVVARIDEYHRTRDEREPGPAEMRPAERFRFETDREGIVRWVDGAERGALIGLSIDFAPRGSASRVDGVASGAFRRRSRFSNARLVVDGTSDAGGKWLISAVPFFDAGSGRFTGYRGTARRPRSDEIARQSLGPLPTSGPAALSLRQLVHELRTPAGAISGFAQMIEGQYLGPVQSGYRDRAAAIQDDTRELLGVIEDLDLAARIEDQSLDLRPRRVALQPLLDQIARDLAPLLELRGSAIAVPTSEISVEGDPRAVERLFARLLATLAASSGRGERIEIGTSRIGDDIVGVTFSRPANLAAYPGEDEASDEEALDDDVALGSGFALRLARNIARELGGSLLFESHGLTLRLPSAETSAMEQAQSS